jgi:hypothetical protein
MWIYTSTPTRLHGVVLSYAHGQLYLHLLSCKQFRFMFGETSNTVSVWVQSEGAHSVEEFHDPEPCVGEGNECLLFVVSLE